MSLKLAYKALSHEQLEILDKKVINGKYKPKVLVKLLKELVSYDRENDQKRESLSSISVFSGVLIGLSIISVIILLFNELYDLLPYPIGSCVLFIVINWWLKAKVKNLKEKDLANEMRRVLFPFALTMQEEAKPDSKISLSLNANIILNDEFLTNDKPHKGTFGRSVKTYKQNWLNANVTLVDNTSLQIQCEKTVHEIDIVKRSASGKMKHKSKTKSRDDIVIRSLMSKSNYQLADIQPSSNIFVEELEDSIALRAKYKFKTEGLKTVQAQTIFDLIHRMYSHVKPI